MYPVKLIPALKDYIWGGTKLRDEYGKNTESPSVAESWELSCHSEGESIAENGSLKGKTLSQIVEAWGAGCLGENSRSFDRFPILIKLINSAQPLSVQVHPNDEYAFAKEGEPGKTEMWYVMEAEEGASIVYGFNRDITKKELELRLKNETVEDVLNVLPVKAGDAFIVEAGLVHAIGKGLLIAEVQQNSNTTYRLYDYGRKTAEGKPRQLHISQSLDVATLTRAQAVKPPQGARHDGYSIYPLADCKYFTVAKYIISKKAALFAGGDSFNAVLATAGSGYINCGGEKYHFKKGETYFIPSGIGSYEVVGDCTILHIKV